jgi:hypothetical protein
VRLKYIAIFTVFLDVVSIPTGNAGGHIAHLGGAAFGFLFGYFSRSGKDITHFLEVFFNLFKAKPSYRIHKNITFKTKSDWDYNAQKNYDQQRIDEILDKIAQSGYDSLTKEEKEILFRSSNK